MRAESELEVVLHSELEVELGAGRRVFPPCSNLLEGDGLH